MSEPHPQTFAECAKYLTKLLLSGQLDDEWARDPDCVKSCVSTVLIGLLEYYRSSLDHTHPIGMSVDENVQAMRELVAACPCNTPVIADTGTDSEKGALVEILLPILLKMLLEWFTKQSPSS